MDTEILIQLNEIINKEKPEIGSITWCDLTIHDAENVKDFYSKVVGWKPEPLSMGEYNDYSMNAPESGKTASGICHTFGVNAGIPPQWLIYITVKDVDESIKVCSESGGKVIVGPKNMGGYGRYCIIQDRQEPFVLCLLLQNKFKIMFLVNGE